ncbi:MAG TPA: LamG-like jellyroll fold domain-containing protein, partial [Fibrobacteria bacterium]|nr:LamG-like jellyroll fold domain-containing protein [Fibrobacteria bacterium]
DTGIVISSAGNEGVGIFNNLIHEPNKYGVYVYSDDRTNIIHNTFVGTGAAGTKGIYMPRDAFGAGYLTITNNIFFNWDFGIHTTDANSEVGRVSCNLFEMITSNREVVGESDGNAIYIDPQFNSTDPGDRNGFKLLGGSLAIDAGTSTINTLAPESWSRVPTTDHFGTSRPQGAYPDVGMYEGTGYTPNPTGTFDSLTNTVSGNTVIVKNSRFKLVWDMARGGGITGFYDMTGDTTANLVGANSLLFDVRIDGMVASAATSNTFAPYFVERTRAKAVVRQRLAVSATLDLNVTYSVHPSGHVYIQSEIANLSSDTAIVDLVQYTVKLGAATAVTRSLGNLTNVNFPYGHVYLTTATKDVLLAAVRWLQEQADDFEIWSQVGSVSGSLDSAGWSVPYQSLLAGYMQRHAHFLLYVGDNSLDAGKASTLSADAWNPSTVGVSTGSLAHERSWQDEIAGHWTFDDGGGTTVKDNSLHNTNNGTATSGTWVSGQVGGAMRFTSSSVVSVADADALEAGRNRTYMLWVKPDFANMGSDAFVLSKGITASSGWSFRRVSGLERFKFVMGALEVECPYLLYWSGWDNNWTHLAATVDGSGQVKLYFDGILVAAGTTSATPTANADALRMGENAGSGAADRFVGDIDDVRIYNRVVSQGAIQAIAARGFSAQYGHYHLRADNNNRVVAQLNESTAQTRMQPAFRIDNWFGPKTPKYVFLNGTRLMPNVDFVSDSARDQGGTWDFGPYLYLQLNKTLTGASQTLFVDDDDSSGYLGEAAKMKSLTVSATANDKIAIQNFSGSTFGSATSGQWYMELDLNGWTTPTRTTLTDTGFGEINVWKAAAVSPNVAVSSATQMVGWGPNTGRSLSYLKLDGTAGPNETYSVGTGYSSSANLTYTLTDSSSTRLSLTLSSISLSGEGTASVSKRFTFYPTGRAFVSYVVSGAAADFDTPRLDLNPRYSDGLASTAWTTATAAANARWALMDGNLDYHSIGFALLSVKNAAATYSAAASMVSSASTASASGASNDQNTAQFLMPTSIWTSANKPVTVNFMMDFSKDFTDSATADSLLKDAQTPAAITAITGTATTNDALDQNADGFAEGDGAYVYTASSGIAHFKFVNTVTHFSPAFRIKSWGVASLPQFVTVDNQTLVKDYHY